MLNPYQPDQILNIVSQTLADILGRDAAEVRADSSLTEDLGAESLDFVELAYALERRLHIALPRKTILDHATAQLGAAELYDSQGGVTETGLYLLQNSFFRFDPAQLRIGMLPVEILSLTTVGNWASLCHALFEYLPEACPDCGGGSAELAPNGKVVCAGCRAALSLPTGDQSLGSYVEQLLRVRPSEVRLVAE